MRHVIFRNISELLTLAPAAAKEGRHIEEADLGVVKDASLVVGDGRILWVGPSRRLKKNVLQSVAPKAKWREVDLGGREVMPGLIECHTHLVFAGDRADEFEWRSQGVGYQEISARGGGIQSTMKATRQASVAELKRLAIQRAKRFVEQGVTTIEIKSGYGLSRAAELKCLKVASELKGPRIIKTFLGPHALPPEYATTQEYVDELIRSVLPVVHKRGLADRVDIFIESGFFSIAEAEKWFDAARALGLGAVAHVDQLTQGGGAAWAAARGSLSVDHCVHLSTAEIAFLAGSRSTVVLLPSADFYLKLSYPKARALIEAGARVALATDFNPGTSPTQDLSLVGVLARLEMKMTLAEVLAAYTVGAAHALNLSADSGSLEPGKEADFVVLNNHWRELFYEVGAPPAHSTWRLGKKLI